MREPGGILTRTWRTAATALSGLTMALALGIYFLPVPFCRYMCDDFVNAAMTQGLGIWRGIVYMYWNLTGRFSSITLYNLYSPLGFAAVPWTPVAGLLALLAALTWSLAQVLPRRPGRFPACLLLSALFMLVFLQAVPNLFQLLYWPAAMLTYLPPIIGIILLAGWAVRIVRRGAAGARRPWRERIGLWLAVLLASGFTETYAILILAALGLGLAASLWQRQGRRDRMLLCLGGMAMALIALWIQIQAPALTVRGDLKIVNLGPAAVIVASLAYSGRLFVSLLSENFLPLLSLLAIGSFLVSRLQPDEERAGLRTRKVLLRAGLAVMAFFLIMAATMTPSFQALGRPPYNRVLTAPVWVFASLWLVLGVLLAPLWPIRGASLRPGLRRVAGPGLAAIALAGIVASAWGSWLQVHDYIPGMRRYAQAWDERDRSIRLQLAEGERDMLVNPLPATGFILDGGAREAGTNPELWLNQAIAKYYGADSLVTPTNAVRPRPRRPRQKSNPGE